MIEDKIKLLHKWFHRQTLITRLGLIYIAFGLAYFSGRLIRIFFYDKMRHISIHTETMRRLNKLDLGIMYDGVINRLIDYYESNKNSKRRKEVKKR